MEDSVTAIDDIKRIVGIRFLGTVSNLEFDRAFAANCAFKSKSDHVYRKINANNINTKVFSHIEIASPDPTSNIYNFLPRFQIQHCNKFFRCVCSEYNFYSKRQTLCSQYNFY
ncbi:hypothetical protein Hanom_Chr14g01255861 [Helianthus anomalus]